MIITTLLLLLGPAAHAQSDPQSYSFDPELYRPATGPYGYVSTHGSSVLKHLQVGVGLYGNYSEDQLMLISPGGQRIYAGEELPFRDDKDGVLDKRSAVDLQFGIGLGPFFEISVDLPVVLWQTGYELANAWDPSVDRDITAAGVGDLRVVPKFELLDLDNQPIGIALITEVTAPTGLGRSFIGDGGFTIMPMAVIELSDQPARTREHLVRFAVNAGYRFRTHKAQYLTLDVGNEFVYRAAFGLSPGTAAEIGVEVSGLLAGDQMVDRPLELSPYVRMHPGELFTIVAGVGFGMIPGRGAPDIRGFVGGTLQPSFNPRDQDRDKDGIPNNKDACENIPEDFDGYQDEDGCPEEDNDSDGIPDVSDSCPDDPEDFDQFQDEDGCPDLDNDGDGIPDVADRCPNQAETFNDYQDDDGCPDVVPVTDRDRDGYMDDADSCPDDPEDFDGYLDEDGCPDPDNDGDGLHDSVDACPNDPEDFDGHNDEDGCPDYDRDRDGILDDDDQCPDDPETVNGFEDLDGCPDVKPPTRVRIERNHIVIDDKIYFEFDSDVIKPISFSLLDEIAALILDNPHLSLVRVEGHTDDVGDEAYNLGLSQRRSDSVRRYLVDRGIEAKRLEARGYGESVPLVQGTDEDARATNRRVEFLIVEQE